MTVAELAAIAVSDFDCPGIHEPPVRRIKITREGPLLAFFDLEGCPPFRVNARDVIWALSDCKKVLSAELIDGGSAPQVGEGKDVLML